MVVSLDIGIARKRHQPATFLPNLIVRSTSVTVKGDWHLITIQVFAFNWFWFFNFDTINVFHKIIRRVSRNFIWFLKMIVVFVKKLCFSKKEFISWKSTLDTWGTEPAVRWTCAREASDRSKKQINDQYPVYFQMMDSKDSHSRTDLQQRSYGCAQQIMHYLPICSRVILLCSIYRKLSSHFSSWLNIGILCRFHELQFKFDLKLAANESRYGYMIDRSLIPCQVQQISFFSGPYLQACKIFQHLCEAILGLLLSVIHTNNGNGLNILPTLNDI